MTKEREREKQRRKREGERVLQTDKRPESQTEHYSGETEEAGYVEITTYIFFGELGIFMSTAGKVCLHVEGILDLVCQICGFLFGVS